MSIPLAILFTLATSSTAMAYKIKVSMENDINHESMTCEVYSIYNGQQEKLKTYRLGKKDPNEGRNSKSFTFNAPLKARTISGKNTYAKMKMKCWTNSRNSDWSIVWDHTDKSFKDYYFRGYCYSSRSDCSVQVKAK